MIHWLIPILMGSIAEMIPPTTPPLVIGLQKEERVVYPLGHQSQKWLRVFHRKQEELKRETPPGAY